MPEQQYETGALERILHKSDSEDYTDTIMIVTSFGIPKAGFQVIGQTILGMLRAGFRVVILTSKPEDSPDEINYDEFFKPYGERLEVIRFSPLIRTLKKWFGVHHRMNDASPEVSNGAENTLSSSETVPYTEGSAILDFLMWASFSIIAPVKTFSVARQCKPSLLYGYGRGSVTASLVGMALRIPVCKRFFGNLMFPGLKNPFYFLKFPHRSLAMTRPGDFFIMTNDGTHGDKVLQRLGVRDNRIQFWINGVSKYDCPPSSGKEKLTQRLGLAIDTRILMTVSRLERLKRVDRAIRIMPKVLAQNVDVVLVVVGSGSERPALESLVKNLGISEHVFFVGSIPHEEVAEFMNACDIFLSFYEHTNLCNPVLEALVCGKPVITLNDGSTEGILESGYNAILIEQDNVERDVPRAILRLLQNDDEVHRLGENARLSAQRELLSWDERIGVEMEELKVLIGSYRKERQNKTWKWLRGD